MNIIELTNWLYWGGLLGFILGLFLIFVVFTRTRNIRWMDAGIVIAALGVVSMLSYGLLWNQRLEARAIEAVVREHEVSAQVVTIRMDLKACMAMHFTCATYAMPYEYGASQGDIASGTLICPGDTCYVKEDWPWRTD